MLEPQLPKLKQLKKNPYNGKYLLDIGDRAFLQIDAKFMSFHRKAKLTNSESIKQHIVVNGEHTPNRSTHIVYLKGDFQDEIIWDLMAMTEYSKQYNKWLNKKVKPLTVTIKCKKKEEVEDE